VFVRILRAGPPVEIQGMPTFYPAVLPNSALFRPLYLGTSSPGPRVEIQDLPNLYPAVLTYIFLQHSPEITPHTIGHEGLLLLSRQQSAVLTAI
jgi:hypothetical protein